MVVSSSSFFFRSRDRRTYITSNIIALQSCNHVLKLLMRRSEHLGINVEDRSLYTCLAQHMCYLICAAMTKGLLLTFSKTSQLEKKDLEK